MTGFIIVGHGNFATGIQSAVELLSGGGEAFKAVDLLPGVSSEELEEKVLSKMSSFADAGCEQFIIFTDVAGGTPFNVSAKIALSDKRVKVVTGINLALLLNMVMEETEDKVGLIPASIQEAIEGMYLVDLG